MWTEATSPICWPSPHPRLGEIRCPYQDISDQRQPQRALPRDSWDSFSLMTLTQAVPPDNGHLQARSGTKSRGRAKAKIPEFPAAEMGAGGSALPP